MSSESLSPSTTFVDPPGPHTSTSRRWTALATVLSASFMILLDISIVNVAIPSIHTEINATFSQIEWVVAGYQLAYAVTLITGGRLGDIYGRKRLFIIGVGGFTLASVACGLAGSGSFLVGARVFQGLMAALMYPQVISVLQVNFAPHDRTKAFGIYGGVVAIAAISGPLIGGILIQGNILGLGWRPIFLVNVPLGIGAVVAAILALDESRAPRATRLDIPGALLATLALFLLVYPLVEGRSLGWPWWTFTSMALSLVVFAIFDQYNHWRAKTSNCPLVEPALFRNRSFLVGLAVICIFLSGIPAFFLTLSLFLQLGHGFSPLQAGVATIPFAITAALGSTLSIRLYPRLGKLILLIGSASITLGMFVLWETLTATSADNTFRGYDLIPSLAMGGLGMGFVIAPLANIILAGVHHDHAGSASGVLTTGQQVAGALGVAIVGVVYFGLLGTYAPTVSAQRSPAFQQQLTTAGATASITSAIDTGFSYCFDDTAAANDPSASPNSCVALQQTLLPPPKASPELLKAYANIHDVISKETTTRLADNFTYAFKYSLIYNVTVWSLTFGLVFFLPTPLQRAYASKRREKVNL